MAIKVFNTLHNKKEEFIPLKENEISMYVCGPTVYSESHIGHGRSSVCFDVIVRYFRYRGYKVHYVRNYTDIDDKIINRANEEGVEFNVISERYVKTFDEDMAGLNIELPTAMPKATESIDNIIALIESLIEKGHGYNVDGNVFYRVRSFDGYGKLSGKNIEDLESGARVSVDERKEDPLDFALWKSSKEGEPSWDSPWGKGRPGWHIECSAMSKEVLGETIDIHGGGKDLIFPHHENEIAQSEGASGRDFVKYWIHNGFVNIDSEKMSKSLGNVLNISDMLDKYTYEALRHFILSNHYRSPIEYTSSSLAEAESAVERFYKTLGRAEEALGGIDVSTLTDKQKENKMKPVVEAMNDDFNTAIVVGKVFEDINNINKLLDKAKDNIYEEVVFAITASVYMFGEVSKFLGFFDRTPKEYFDDIKSRSSVSPEEVEKLIAERIEARNNKDFARADEIRDELKSKGIILEDSSQGTTWTVETS